MSTRTAKRIGGAFALAIVIGHAQPGHSLEVDTQVSKFRNQVVIGVSGIAEDRNIDCRGHAATVSGSSNNVDLRNCSRVSVYGASNNVRIIFSGDGAVRIAGSANDVLIVDNGYEVSISDLGTNNDIVRE